MWSSEQPFDLGGAGTGPSGTSTRMSTGDSGSPLVSDATRRSSSSAGAQWGVRRGGLGQLDQRRAKPVERGSEPRASVGSVATRCREGGTANVDAATARTLWNWFEMVWTRHAGPFGEIAGGDRFPTLGECALPTASRMRLGSRAVAVRPIGPGARRTWQESRVRPRSVTCVGRD